MADHFSLKWRVQPAPTGRWKSFEKRGWPTADFAGTDICAARIDCDDSYNPRNAKEFLHSPLSVYVAKYNHDRSNGQGAFNWVRIKRTFSSVTEAKDAAAEAIRQHPEFMPVQLKKD
ncbi:hypothetical protein [Stenotrophomonas muris]|uniref:hypothetical protein n=1 Tax=Stenotrophomonas muris TaxID=2963283 RepID=UPI0039C5F69B